MDRLRLIVVVTCPAVVLMLLCCGVVWLMNETREMVEEKEQFFRERQDKALVEIERMCGRVVRDSQNPRWPVTEVTIGNSNYVVTDKDMEVFKGLPEVHSLTMYRCDLTGNGLAISKGCPNSIFSHLVAALPTKAWPLFAR